jgi:hypothetical protein
MKELLKGLVKSNEECHCQTHFANHEPNKKGPKKKSSVLVLPLFCASTDRDSQQMAEE